MAMDNERSFWPAPPKGPCQKCAVNPATDWWVGEMGGVMAASRGLAVEWCRRCCVVAQIEYAEKAAAGLLKLKMALAAIDGIPSTVAPSPAVGAMLDGLRTHDTACLMDGGCVPRCVERGRIVEELRAAWPVVPLPNGAKSLARTIARLESQRDRAIAVKDSLEGEHLSDYFSNEVYLTAARLAHAHRRAADAVAIRVADYLDDARATVARVWPVVPREVREAATRILDGDLLARNAEVLARFVLSLTAPTEARKDTP